MKIRIIRAVIEWLNQRYPYLCQDVVIPPGHHVHKDPVRKRSNQTELEVAG